MAFAQLLKIAHGDDDKVKGINERVQVHDVGETVPDVDSKVS